LVTGINRFNWGYSRAIIPFKEVPEKGRGLTLTLKAGLRLKGSWQKKAGFGITETFYFSFTKVGREEKGLEIPQRRLIPIKD